MSTVLGGKVGHAPPGPHDVPASVVGASMLSALQAAAASLVLVLVPVIGSWIVGTGGSATWTDVVRIALDLWLLAQHGGLVVADGHVGLVPLGLSCAPLAACWYAGRRLGRVLDPQGERIAAGLTRARPAFPPMRALALFASTYALLAGITGAVASMESARPIPGQAFFGAAVIASAAGSLGAGTYRFGSARVALVRAGRLLPGAVRGWVRLALVAVGLHLAVSLVVLAGMLLAHRDQVLALHQALQPDAAGGVVLVLAQVLLLPNFVLWTACVLAGPGFAVGTGTSVTATSAVLGPLPALPALGALPAPGPLPTAVAALLAVPVLAGLVAGILLPRRASGPWWRTSLDALGVALIAGLVFTALAWLSGGPAGPGRLAVTGPVPWLAGLWFAAEIAAGALLAVLGGRGVPALVHRSRGRFRGGPTRSWSWNESGPVEWNGAAEWDDTPEWRPADRGRD
ncbi:MAG TPA: DUF6350 family protein [Kineosporiaceae bacterium]|nr:DUF6350 family protein [Kineosporiaceae bacterium]